MSESLLPLRLRDIPELQHDDLPPQFTQIGQGGQFRVFMLTDPQLSKQSTPDEHYIVPRVVKEGLNSHEMGLFVRDHIGIADPFEQAVKIAGLTIRQLATFNLMLALSAASSHHTLGDYLGEPTLLWNYDPVPPPEGHFFSTLLYAQDYKQPVHQLLSRLEAKPSLQKRMGRHIIDQYVQLQPISMQSGSFDTTYKLADNCGVDTCAELSINDFNEFTQDYDEVAASIKTREWERIGSRREYTHLPANLFDYFCDRMNHHVTLKLLEDEWERDYSSPSVRIPIQLVRSRLDSEASRLWNARPQASTSADRAEIAPEVGRMAYGLMMRKILSYQ